MKLTMKLLAVFGLVLTTFNPQAAASADMYRYEGYGVWATFYSIDTSGCIKTAVNIELGENVMYSIALSQYDLCLGQGVLDAYGYKLLSKSEVKIENMNSATLKTTVHVTDNYRNIDSDVSIDLTWTGTGDVLAYHDHHHDQPWPHCTMNGIDRQRYRAAQASGTVSDGTTNFTPEPSKIAHFNFWKQTAAQSHGCE
jgi:hypothetical protein